MAEDGRRRAPATPTHQIEGHAMARQYEFDDDEPFVVIEKEQGTLSSFFVGLAIGAGLALLFAPRSGLETRREIKRRARSAERAARRVASDVTDSVSDKFNDARRRVERRIDRTRQAIEMKKEQVHRAMEAGRAAAQEARDELERRIAETKAAYQAGGEVAHATRRSAATTRVVAPTAAEADEESETT